MISSQEKCIPVTLNLHTQFVTLLFLEDGYTSWLEDSLLNCVVLECKCEFTGGILSICEQGLVLPHFLFSLVSNL